MENKYKQGEYLLIWTHQARENMFQKEKKNKFARGGRVVVIVERPYSWGFLCYLNGVLMLGYLCGRAFRYWIVLEDIVLVD